MLAAKMHMQLSIDVECTKPHVPFLRFPEVQVEMQVVLKVCQAQRDGR